MEFGVADAKNNLPKLIGAAMRGERVVITRRGRPAVELVRVERSQRKGFGSMPGLTDSLPPGWDSPELNDEFLHSFDKLSL